MKKKFIGNLIFTTLALGCLTACPSKPEETVVDPNDPNGSNNPDNPNPGVDEEVEFSIQTESGRTIFEKGEKDKIVITVSKGKAANENFKFKVNGQSPVASLGTPDGLTCEFTCLDAGKATFTISYEKGDDVKRQVLTITINPPAENANGGFNYASISGATAIQTRTEILGKLEKYAVESHLTGITLFENGGYAKYSSRLEIPTEEYITGYGFGILSEGNITEDLAGATAKYKRYYHSAQSSNPGKINAADDTGSQVSGLADYICSPYWGTKMNSTKNGYDWYPILAKDKVNGKPFNRPIPVYEGSANPLNLYKRWRIYVKTGADGLKYRTNGRFKADWDNREVQIEDYEFAFKMLLTGANALTRGREMSADKTYGIKGAASYFNRTKSNDIDQATVDKTWNDMKASGELGFSYGSDTNGAYIEIELINEIDDFTAMYQLSSNLYTPLPQAFVQMLGNGEVKNGAKVYGEGKENFDLGGGNKVKLSPNDTALSLGAYYLEEWSDEFIAFKQNDTWFERQTYPLRHRIEGIKITTYKSAQEQPDALYELFYKDLLDSCGVPTLHIEEEKSPSKTTTAGKTTRTLITKGDSTFKLNVNSCTQERWDYLFGNNGKICVTDDASKYVCKPWMSNDNFLNGLYWSINRKEFAESQGAQPSIDYLSNAYLSDPENGVAYNSTEAHKKAVASMHNVDAEGNDDYGYNRDKAIKYFKAAYTELKRKGAIKDGTKSKPTIIKIRINWMYQNDITEYGTKIKQYFESAFNDESVCDGKVKLEVEQPNPSSDWQAVYNDVMMKGQFDLAFGAISGNTYNPLNFFEVLKSDNSSGFTLNWGADTSVVDEKNPIIYDGHKFSFDALWTVADHGGIVENGKVVNPIKDCYLDNPTTLSGDVTDKLYEGFKVNIPMEFVNVDDIELNVSKVALFVVNGETHDVEFNYDKTNKVISVTIPASLAATIESEIKTAQKKTDPDKEGYIEHPFSRAYYTGSGQGSFWNFELTYTLSIKGGTPSANTVTVAMTKDQQKY